MRAIYVLLTAIGIAAIIVISIKDNDKPKLKVFNYYQATIVCGCDLNGDTVMVSDTTGLTARAGDTVLISSIANNLYHRVDYNQNVADLDTVTTKSKYSGKLFKPGKGVSVSNREAVIISQASQ
jgi:hypothetical protein